MLVLREVTSVYHLGDLQGKVDHVLLMADLKLCGQNGKQIHTLFHMVQIISEDMGMEFGISKYARLIMKRVIISRSEGTQLLNVEVLKGIEKVLKMERDIRT